MRVIATTYKPQPEPERPREWIVKIKAKRRTYQRIGRWIQSTDWDQKLMDCEKWINRICWIFIIFATFFFLKILVSQ